MRRYWISWNQSPITMAETNEVAIYGRGPGENCCDKDTESANDARRGDGCGGPGSLSGGWAGERAASECASEGGGTPRYAAPQARQQARQQYRQQLRQQYGQAPQASIGRRRSRAGGSMAGASISSIRDGEGPGIPQGNLAQPGYAGNGGQRRAYAGPGAAPQGHLEDWLNQHRNVPVQDQERMLSNDPSFRRLAPGDQQRLAQQLRQVDRMPEQQRERRLARNEMLERLSPTQRMSIARSGQQWATLPPDRQTMMKRAFNDLRGVPPDQRETVLNSARYQGAFSPEERGILSDFLRVEPYEPR